MRPFTPPVSGANVLPGSSLSRSPWTGAGYTSRTRAGETYFAHVVHVRTDSGLLIFDLRLYDRDGCLYEACSGVRMNDVSGGKLNPPHWIKITEADRTTDRMAARCDAMAVIELISVAPFADKVLSAERASALKA